MAIRRSQRTIGSIPIATVLEVNDETGEAFLYENKGIFGRTLIATSDNVGDEWNVTNQFRRTWNNTNGTTLNNTQFNDFFDTELRKTFNNDRASLINAHSNNDVKRALKEAGVPGVKDPETNTTSDNTTDTPTVADNSRDQGDTTKTASNLNLSGLRGVSILDGKGMPTSKNLRYPVDMSDEMNKLQINIREYSPKGIDNKKGTFQTADRQKGNIITTIFLPIPGGIQDQNQVSWGKGDMNALQQAAAQFAVDTITKGVEGAKQSATEIAENITKNTGDLKNLAAAAMAGAASGLGSQLLTRQTGLIINPNAELLFQGPSMRQFGFSFNMSARSEGEATSILTIIRALKQGMSVRRSESGLFLMSPYLFELKYLAGSDALNPNLNKFKMCAMTGLNVNYTPNQTFMAFENNMPVAYQLNMQFQELEPIFNDDYNADNSIGF